MSVASVRVRAGWSPFLSRRRADATPRQSAHMEKEDVKKKKKKMKGKGAEGVGVQPPPPPSAPLCPRGKKLLPSTFGAHEATSSSLSAPPIFNHCDLQRRRDERLWFFPSSQSCSCLLIERVIHGFI